MPTGKYKRTPKIIESLKKRRIAPRTEEWKERISIALKKEKIEKRCPCGKLFEVHPYRKETAKYCSHICRAKYRIFKKPGYKCPRGSWAKLGNKNPMYGKFKKNILYGQIHLRIKKVFPKPKLCEFCKKKKKLELSNKNHKYSLDPNDYQWLCKKCHFHYDKHEKFLETGRAKRLQNLKRKHYV